MDPANLLAASVAVMRIAAGELTSEGLVRACLERIAERDADVGAWEHVDPEATLAEARARDTRPPLGPRGSAGRGAAGMLGCAGESTSVRRRGVRGPAPAGYACATTGSDSGRTES